MSHYRHLSIEEREKLYLMAEQGGGQELTRQKGAGENDIGLCEP